MPSDQEFVEMILSDLSERPFSWPFSSPYALFTSQTHSVPVREFGTTEYSFEELRLQAYAEARMTGGRIDNYKSIVEGIRLKAEMATKAIIPRLHEIVKEARRTTPTLNLPSHPHLHPQPHQQPSNSYQQSAPHISYTHTPSQSFNSRSNSGSNLQSYPDSQIHPPPTTSTTISYSPSQTIIPDSHFVFGQIPEMPPE